MLMFPAVLDAHGVELLLYSGSGSNSDVDLTLQDTAGAAVDITGWTLKAVCKADVDDADAGAVFGPVTCAVTSGPVGQFQLPMNAVNIAAASVPQEAVLIFYRVQGAANVVIAQYRVKLLKSGIGQ